MAAELTAPILRALVADGKRLWVLEHDEPPELKDVVWKLLEEAADTLRALTADRPRGFSSGWPDIEQLSQDALENARNIERDEAGRQGRPFDEDLYRVEPRPGSKPTAAAVRRLLVELALLKSIKSRSIAQKRAKMKLMLALASGMSPTRAASAFPDLGYTNKNAVLSARYRAIENICAKIERICGRIDIQAAA